MNVSIVAGSIRQERQSHRVAYYLKDQLTEKGTVVDLIDLRDHPLPIFGLSISDEVRKSIGGISARLKGAQAVIIVTPEYSSNIPSALQNLLEYCGRDFIGKVTGIVSASASKFGGWHASGNLRTFLLNIGAYPVPGRLMVPEVHLAFSQDNKPVQQEMMEQAEKFIAGLLSYMELMVK